MKDVDPQHADHQATSLACYLTALQGDTVGLALMLDGMTWLELRNVASAALHVAADMTANGSDTPSRERLDRMIELLKAQVATLRVQAMR